MDWKKWAKLFWSFDPNMLAVYLTLSMFIFIFLLFLGVLPTFDPLGIFFSVIAILSIYAVFTDEVAHLYPYINSPITHREWLSKVIHGRTHDVYGMVIFYVSFIFAVYYSYVIPDRSSFGLLWAIYTYVALFIFVSIIIHDFYKHRFYH